MIQKCPTCNRELYSGLTDGALTIDVCPAQGSVSCVLATQRNSLGAALKRLAGANCEAAVKRSCLAIYDQIYPPSTSCPSCAQPGVVVGGEVRVHHARPQDLRPCGASFRRVIGGELV